ncbi:MAG TPA: hypothetical protein VL977_03535 [Solirubrobacteraceae bacterium]|nr:hypothetical protein [Solirubrobacteraceae bacterium]
MSSPSRAVIFIAAAAVSLGASWLLVLAIERIGKRLRLSEALLGMVAALAADAPEITTAVTALLDHSRRVGAGVVLGSNAFNIATLLGLGALTAGFISLHRRVVAMNGAVAVWAALACILAVTGALDSAAALALAAAVVIPYIGLLAGVRPRLPARWSEWLATAVGEEELELEEAIHPASGSGRDLALAAAALAVVVGASVTMEREATALGGHWGIAPIIVGGLVLAAVTSLPNAVAGVYLAARGRGAASLSTALNSNLLNVIAGLLIPGALLGIGSADAQTLLITAAYAALTVLALAAAWPRRGLGRGAGALLAGGYLAFTIALIASV